MAKRRGVMHGGAIVPVHSSEKYGTHYVPATYKTHRRGGISKKTMLKGNQVPWAFALQQAWHTVRGSERKAINNDTNDPDNIAMRKDIFKRAKNIYNRYKNADATGSARAALKYEQIAFGTGKHATRNIKRLQRFKSLAGIRKLARKGKKSAIDTEKGKHVYIPYAGEAVGQL